MSDVHVVHQNDTVLAVHLSKEGALRKVGTLTRDPKWKCVAMSEHGAHLQNGIIYLRTFEGEP